MWMNEPEIDIAVQRYQFGRNPAMHAAVMYLSAFRDQVNAHSDGWAYWRAAALAARKLMELIHTKHQDATMDDVRKAITPIKSFMTRKGKAAGMQMPILD